MSDQHPRRIGTGGKLLRSGEPLKSFKTNASVSSFCLLPTSTTLQQQKSRPSLLAEVKNEQQLISITRSPLQSEILRGGRSFFHPIRSRFQIVRHYPKLIR